MKAAATSRAAKTLRNDAREKSVGDRLLGTRSTHVAQDERDAPLVHLTVREREVLALLCDGLPNKLIARHLRISAGTVKVHISNIFRVLNVSNRLQALVLARRWGLIHPVNHTDHGRHSGAPNIADRMQRPGTGEES